jgi:hypothetical protein
MTSKCAFGYAGIDDRISGRGYESCCGAFRSWMFPSLFMLLVVVGKLSLGKRTHGGGGILVDPMSVCGKLYTIAVLETYLLRSATVGY